MTDKSTQRVLFLRPDGFRYAVSPRGNVAVRIDIDPEVSGLSPDIGLAVELTPTEARTLAQALQNMARSAEGKSLNG